MTHDNSHQPGDEIAKAKAAILPTAKDLRRAAQLLVAADPMRFNLDAVAAVVAEVKQTDRRVTQLLTGMAVLAYQTPDLGTDDGQRALRNAWKHHRQKEIGETQ